MKPFAAVLIPALCLAAVGLPALGQEAISTGNGGAPPVSDTNVVKATDTQAAAATPQRDAKPSRCAAAKGDGKPHGEVWAGIGTRGYREVGGVVTQPVGDCATVTLMVDHTEADFGRPGRPR